MLCRAEDGTGGLAAGQGLYHRTVSPALASFFILTVLHLGGMSLVLNLLHSGLMVRNVCDKKKKKL